MVWNSYRWPDFVFSIPFDRNTFEPLPSVKHTSLLGLIHPWCLCPNFENEISVHNFQGDYELPWFSAGDTLSPFQTSRNQQLCFIVLQIANTR